MMKSGDFISDVEPRIPRTYAWLLTTLSRWRVSDLIHATVAEWSGLIHTTVAE